MLELKDSIPIQTKHTNAVHSQKRRKPSKHKHNPAEIDSNNRSRKMIGSNKHRRNYPPGQKSGDWVGDHTPERQRKAKARTV